MEATSPKEETRVSSFLFEGMNLTGPNPNLLSRQQRLRALMEERRLRFVLVSDPRNVFYITGFRGSVGLLVFGLKEATLFVDPRYTLQARKESQGVEVREARRRLLTVAGQWLSKRRARDVGYDDAYVSCAAFRELTSHLLEPALKVARGLVEELRRVKDPGEIALIREAAQVTSSVFEEIRKTLRPGLNEMDLAAEIEYRIRRKGADGVAFETIVASGERSAWPHARASSKLLKKNELVIIDLGAILRAYASDMTRTLFLGKPSPEVREMYRAVLGAQQEVLNSLRTGARPGRLDAEARRALSRNALEKYFTHSTGHGVGLDIHEWPRLARGEKIPLPSGCVITVEPGVYVEGVGGVRIEDTVLVTEAGGEVLTSAPKDDWIIA